MYIGFEWYRLRNSASMSVARLSLLSKRDLLTAYFKPGLGFIDGQAKFGLKTTGEAALFSNKHGSG